MDYSIQIRVEAGAAQAQLNRLERELRNVDRTSHRYRQTLQSTRQSLNLVANSTGQATQQTSSFRSNLQQIANNTRSADNNLRLLNTHILSLVNSVRDLSTQLNSANAGLGNIQRVTTNAGNSTREASNNFDRLATRLTGVTTAAINLKTVFASLGGALSLSWVASTIFDFEKQLSAVKAVSGATGQAFDELRAKAQELGQTTIYTAGQAAEGMRAMAQAGFTANEILAASDKVLALAQVGQMDLGRTAEIAARALRGFHIEATDMSRVADVMAKTATRSTADIEGLGYAFKYVSGFAASMGIDIEHTAAAIGVLSDAGIDASMAGTGLRGVISKLMNQSAPGIKILKAYNIEMEDLNVKTHGLVGALENLKKSGISGDALVSVFGQRAGPAIVTLLDNLDVYKKRIQELRDEQGTVTKTQKVMDENIYASFKKLVSALEAFITETGRASGAIEAIKKTFDALAESVKWVTNNSNYFLPVIGIMIARFTGLGTAMRSTATGAGTVISSLSGMSFAALRLNSSLLAVAASARVVAGVGKVLKGAFAFIGGWPGLLLGVASYLLPIITKTEEAAGVTDRLAHAWNAMYENGLNAKEAVKQFNEQIKNMTKGELELELKANDISLKKMKDAIQAEIDSWGITLDYGDWWSDLVVPVNEVTDPLVDIKKELQSLHDKFNSGKITVDDYKEALNKVRLVTIESHPEFDKSVQKIQKWVLQIQLAVNAGYSLADAINKANESIKSMGDTVDEEAGMLSTAVTKLADSYQTALFIQKQEKGARSFLRELAAAGVDVKNDIQGFDKSVGILWKETSKIKDNQAITKMANDAYFASQKIDQLKESEKALNKRSSAVGKSDITAPMKQIEQLRNEIEELNGTSNQGVSKLSEKMTEIMQVGQKAKLSAQEIQELQFNYGEAFKAKTLRDFNQELLNLQGATDKVQQIKFEETLREWEQRLTGIGLSSSEVATKINQLRDALQQQQFTDNLSKYRDLAQLLNADIESSANYQKMLQNETATLTSKLEQLGVQIDSNKQKWVETYVASNASNGAFSGIIDGYMELTKSAKNWASTTKQLFTDTFDGLADTIATFVVEGKNNFSDFAKSVVNDIAKMITKMLIMRMVMGLVGMIGGSFFGGSSFNGLNASAATGAANTSMYAGMGTRWSGGSAKGNVFGGGSLADYANSIVTQPTPFSYASAHGKYGKGAGLMGESGWEAILPLKRSSDGRLGVEATNKSSGNPIVNINVINESGQNVAATGQATSNSSGGFDLDVVISQIDQGMAKMAKQGKSSFVHYQEKTYGMNRASVLTRMRGRV